MTFKYSEDKTLAELEAYLKGTYSEHYVSEDNEVEVQCFDIWISSGSAETTARDNAIKYLQRYGKKEGKNRKDLLKAMHYLFLMLHCNAREAKRNSKKVVNTDKNSTK